MFKELEQLDGPAFKHAVRQEDAIWHRRTHRLRNEIQKWKADFIQLQSDAWPEIPEYAIAVFTINTIDNNYTVQIQRGAAGYTYNVWIRDTSGYIVWSKKGLSGFQTYHSGFLTTEDIGSGSEHLELCVYEWPANLLWKRDPVGPSIAISKSLLYFSSVENALRYPDVRCVDIQTGYNESVLFTEPNKRVQVSILGRKSKEGDDIVFVHLANALSQRIGYVDHSSIKWMTGTIQSTLIPVSKTMWFTDRYLETSHSKKVPLPDQHHIVDAVQHGLNVFVIMVRKGQTSLWLYKRAQWISLLNPRQICDIQIIYEQDVGNPKFLVRCPNRPDEIYEYIYKDRLVLVLRYPEPIPLQTILEGCANSKDVCVPYTVVCKRDVMPTKLLVDAYGAYGISSKRAYPIRWLAWIKRGYAVAYVSPRGGREDGDPWYDGGRTAIRKHHTFIDTAAAIAEIQTHLSIPPSRTVFFGRSAGGWLAANIAQEHGHLVAAIYAEVPYVDVLQTTSNPALPLTQLEYDEFGDPVHRSADRVALEKISPIDTVPFCVNKKCPTVLIRTGLHDMQVLPYEALKWSAQLRKKGWPNVLVGIDHGGGHFAAANQLVHQRSEDAAILDFAIEEEDVRHPRRFTKKSSRGVRRGKMTRRRS